jgi:phage-related protein
MLSETQVRLYEMTVKMVKQGWYFFLYKKRIKKIAMPWQGKILELISGG